MKTVGFQCLSLLLENNHYFLLFLLMSSNNNHNIDLRLSKVCPHFTVWDIKIKVKYSEHMYYSVLAILAVKKNFVCF